jgi:hypothetical protein
MPMQVSTFKTVTEHRVTRLIHKLDVSKGF